MKKILLSVICSSFIFADTFINPLPASSRSTENGGTLSAIDAYQDGVGAMVIQQGRGIDNSAMNVLVFKYGNEAKENSLSLCDQVVLSGSIKDKILNGALCADGVSCNDNNPISIGETYLNGVCQGGQIPNNLPCDDNNPQTISDIYTNGVCAGTNVQGQACDDGNVYTIGSTYNNGICQGGTIPNGTLCNDLNIMTVNDVYTNQICSGTLTVNGQSCNDGNVMTVNDIYTNGVCAGTLTVNGTTCTHTDPKVINETWLNGVCQGTLTVNGQSCSDGNVMTVNDIYTNGVCTGTLTVNGATCTHSDPKVVNETWLNGVCTGTLTVNGATCTHSDPKVVNETWLNGVCTGTLTVNGDLCDDMNSQTINDTWKDGLCSGLEISSFTSCLDYYESGIRDDGIYTIYPSGQNLSTYCDMSNGGWTLVMNNIGNKNNLDLKINNVTSLSNIIHGNLNTKLFFNGQKEIKWTYSGGILLHVKENGAIYSDKPTMSTPYNAACPSTSLKYSFNIISKSSAWKNTHTPSSSYLGGVYCSSWVDYGSVVMNYIAATDCDVCHHPSNNFFGNGASDYFAYGSFYDYDRLAWTGNGLFSGTIPAGWNSTTNHQLWIK